MAGVGQVGCLPGNRAVVGIAVEDSQTLVGRGGGDGEVHPGTPPAFTGAPPSVRPADDRQRHSYVRWVVAVWWAGERMRSSARAV
jgi:hypothetical protein